MHRAASPLAKEAIEAIVLVIAGEVVGVSRPKDALNPNECVALGMSALHGSGREG